MTSSTLSERTRRQLARRKLEMEQMLKPGESILDTRELEFVQSEGVRFFDCITNVENSEELKALPLIDVIKEFLKEEVRCGVKDIPHPKTFMSVNYIAAVINYIAMEIEFIENYGNDELKQVFDNVQINDLFSNYSSLTQDEIVNIIKAIRNNISHNNEAISEDGGYSSVKFTSNGNVLIDIFLRGHQTVVKTDIKKLTDFINQITSHKQTLNNTAIDLYEKFLKENADKFKNPTEAAQAFFASITEKQKAYFTWFGYEDLNHNIKKELYGDLENLTNIFTEYLYTSRGLTATTSQVLELKQRLKLFRAGIADAFPNFASPENEELTMQIIAQYLDYYANYLTAKSNTSSLVAIFSHYNYHEYPLAKLNLDFVLENSSGENKIPKDDQHQLFDAIFNHFFSEKELYPAVVMNFAKTIFTNHEKELYDYIHDPFAYTSKNKTITDIIRKIDYPKDHLHAKLRNSTHHGRYLFLYPNKSSFDTNKVMVELYDGTDNNNLAKITTLSIGDIAKLSQDFYKYLDARKKHLEATTSPTGPS